MKFYFKDEKQLEGALITALNKAEEAAYRLKVTTTQERRRIQVHELMHALFSGSGDRRMKEYATIPSENFAERENQVKDYHPDLCFKTGQIHRAYNWSPIPRGDWNEEQTAAYMKAWELSR